MGEQLQRYEELENDETHAHTVKSIAQNKEQIASHKRRQSEYKKRIRQIESSNTWKIGNLFNPLRNLWQKLFSNSAVYNDKIAQLEAEIIQQEKQIEDLHDELIPLRLLNEQLTSHSIIQQIRSLKEDGKLLENLSDIVEQKINIETNYREALLYIARLYMNEDAEIRNSIYNTILSSLANEEIPEFMIRAGLSTSPISLRHTSSFRGSLSSRMRQKQLIGTLPEWHLDDKLTAYDFVKQFDIVVPMLDEKTYTINTIPEKEAIVVKPIDAAGARGVYLIHTRNNIFDVRNAQTLHNFDQLKEAMQRDIASGAVQEDAWLIEQLIYENRRQLLPARDMKFYSFYGKVGLILEIVRDPEIRHTWWTRDGKRIGTGKYEATLFAGRGVSEAEIERVEKLSSAIPAPFMRIDFLQEESELVFGEFTPKPGNYDDFDQKTDAWLGDYFVDAEGRLIQDLLNGKTFPEYNKFIQALEERDTKQKLNV